MWADTLLAAERAHLLRLALWAMSSILAGTSLFLLPRVRRGSSALVRHFAIQAVAWGVIELLITWSVRTSLGLRDLGGAQRLERFLWLNTGLDVGYIAVGLMLAATCWTLGRRMGGIGAGIGVITQGAALLWLDFSFAHALRLLV